MKRRRFVSLLGGVAAPWPLAVHAQRRAMPLIGFLNGQSLEGFARHLIPFRDALRQAGYVEGQTVAIEYRWGHGQLDRLPEMAAELVARRVDVLVATAGAQLAAKRATATIPVVFVTGGDPVKAGLVASLNRPGGNVTGVSQLAFSLGAKRLEVLREVFPNVKLVAVLVNPRHPDPESRIDAQRVRDTAAELRQDVEFLSASNDADLETVFASLPQRRIGAVLVMADPFFNSRRNKIVALAARAAIPAIYEWREFAAAGGLMSYGSSISDAFRQLGIYTGRVLKGEKPADLPVVQTVKVELVINLNTAKSLGLNIPIAILGRADEVIE